MTPARLGKKSEDTKFSDKIKLSDYVDNDFFCCNSFLRSRIEAWCIEHATILLVLSIILCLLLFMVACYTLVGVSATESGTVYNQFNRII